MRPAEVTSEQIIQAGHALQAAGRNVNGFSLRQKIGGGNTARLRAVWTDHVAATEITHAEPVSELPTEIAGELDSVIGALADRIRNLTVELNDRAVKAAERRVAEVVRAAGEEREKVKRELVEADEAMEELGIRNQALDDQIESTGTLLAEAERSKQVQAIEITKLGERLEAETRAREAALVLSDKLNETVNALNDKLAAIEQRATKLEARNTDLEDEMGRLRGDLAVSQDGHREQTAAVARLTSQKDRLQEDLAAEKRKVAETADRNREMLIKLEAEISESRKSEIALMEKVATLAGELNGMRAVIEKLGMAKG